MYTLETLIPDCVGRYITNGSGSVQLASLINGRTYAKCWQALVYWIVSQYEMGNSTNCAPLGVIVRTPAANSGAGAASSSSSVAGPNDAPKGASFRFFKSFLDKHGLKLRAGGSSGGDPIREDDLSTIRMNLATLARLADVEPGTFRVALSHLFRRLGEVLQAKEQVLIDFSVGSLIGDKATVDFLFHQTNADVNEDPKKVRRRQTQGARKTERAGRANAADAHSLLPCAL